MTTITNRSCSVDSCDNIYDGKTADGLCRAHYRLAKKDPSYRPTGTCSVETCEFRVLAKGLCRLHWERLRRNGEVGSPHSLIEFHGMTNSRTHAAWTEMRRRCFEASRPGFKYYGGRGITVCARWSRFSHFLADMGECPSGKTLDRIDVNGNYEPGNCRWATARQQTLNRRAFGYSKYRGVQLRRGQWIAVIAPHPNVHIYLGAFKSEIEGAIAWNFAAFFIYGTDANLNTMPPYLPSRANVSCDH